MRRLVRCLAPIYFVSLSMYISASLVISSFFCQLVLVQLVTSADNGLRHAKW